MYLFQLDATERECFLELAWQVVICDGKPGAEEQEIFQSYQHECEQPDFQPTGKPLAALLDVLKHAPKPKRRIVCIELFGLILADAKYRREEQAVMDKIGEAFMIFPAEMAQLKAWVQRFMATIADGQALIIK